MFVIMVKLKPKKLKFAKQFCSICTIQSHLQVPLAMMCTLSIAVIVLP